MKVGQELKTINDIHMAVFVLDVHSVVSVESCSSIIYYPKIAGPKKSNSSDSILTSKWSFRNFQNEFAADFEPQPLSGLDMEIQVCRVLPSFCELDNHNT